MKLMNIAAIAATAGLIFSACSQEELVYQPTKTQEEYPMGFSAGVPNMTRTTALNEFGPEGAKHTDFGVWTVKTKEKDNGDNTTSDIKEYPMENYKVEYKSSKPDTGGATWGDGENKTPGLSYWVYDGIGSQVLKYWDPGAKQYEFFAYTPHSTNATTVDETDPTDKEVWFNKKTNTLKVKAASAFSNATSPTYKDNLVAYTSIMNDKYLNLGIPQNATNYVNKFEADVPLTFKHTLAQVHLAFYSTMPNYEITITGLTVDMAKLGKTGIVEVGGTSFTSVSGITTTSWSATTNFGTVQKFDGNATKTLKEPANFFYGLPAATEDNKNSKMTVKVTQILIAPKPGNTGETYTINNASVEVAETYTQWESNKVYTYVFKIGLDPIVFDGIIVNNYEEVGTVNNNNADYTIRPTVTTTPGGSE